MRTRRAGPTSWDTASDGTRRLSVAGFLMGSLGTYTANCLTSAPYNAILMDGAENVDRDKLTIAI